MNPVVLGPQGQIMINRLNNGQVSFIFGRSKRSPDFKVLNLFLRFLVFNLFSGMREGVALSINEYVIVICFHTFMISLKYFSFKRIVS